jgi:cytosine/adenosine deaminase-related metal-dependent hydrolase
MNETPGFVCGHHHLYSTLARYLPAPPRRPESFVEILELVWWRLDAALDLDAIYWSAALGAAEAVRCGTTGIVDHHEGPSAIEGSLDAIARACADVGVRVVATYGASDRWDDRGTLRAVHDAPPSAMTDGARRGLAECERFVRTGGRGMVGLHAAFTCSTETIEAAAGLARDLGVGVHVHVGEDAVDADAARRLATLTDDRWLLAHAIHVDQPLRGTIAHNPRSNMHNSVGYARPADCDNPVVLGSDGFGADMLEEYRLAFAAHRAHDRTAEVDTAWRWLTATIDLVPECAADRVEWSDPVITPAYTAVRPGLRAVNVVRDDGEVLVRDGLPTRVDLAELRAKAAEAATRVFARL